VEPWQSKLAEGNPQAAWDLFASRYRKLILATIRRLIRDHDQVMDGFSEVCAALAANDLARLQRFTERHPRGASAATWLVVVVRNLTIDWVRKQEGRDRHQLPSGLSPLQQQIYTAVFLEGASHVEAYETIRAQGGTQESFPAFLREVRETYRLAPRSSGAMLRAPGPPPAPELEPTITLPDPAETAESSRRVANALAGLAPDVALAVQLFVVDRLSAAEIARAVGWPNPKMVYNKVYRALTALRQGFEREGIGRGDLG
jgi:RNA polymerase sigma factor (sigma-70 family)